MTSAVRPSSEVRQDVRTVVTGGFKLGVITAVGASVFALASRPLSGIAETVLQTVLVLAGGVVFAFLPAVWVRPRDVDSIAWATMLAVLGAVVFTAIDTAVLRPLNLYHWTWDQIGGGSGFWYIPVWWMGSATLAWLGALGFSLTRGNLGKAVGTTLGITVVLTGILVIAVFPFHAATVALAFALGLVGHALLAAVLQGQ